MSWHRLVVVSGTGTGIGKTVVATALLRAAGLRAPVLGLKPVETGGTADGQALEQASTFHVTRFTSPYLLTDPVSPHLAARRSGTELDLSVIAAWVAHARSLAPALVELAGGFFTPLSPTETNATLTAALVPEAVVLVAPDRLGVLHDVLATARAAEAAGVRLSGIILSAPADPDSSTGTNGNELALVLPAVPVLASLPRSSSPAELAARVAPALAQLAWPHPPTD